MRIKDGPTIMVSGLRLIAGNFGCFWSEIGALRLQTPGEELLEPALAA